MGVLSSTLGGVGTKCVLSRSQVDGSWCIVALGDKGEGAGGDTVLLKIGGMSSARNVQGRLVVGSAVLHGVGEDRDEAVEGWVEAVESVAEFIREEERKEKRAKEREGAM